MTLVKKQYNGRELPVFDNMDQAMEYFDGRRETIHKEISALFWFLVLYWVFFKFCLIRLLFLF